jgi:hypothetical protein
MESILLAVPEVIPAITTTEYRVSCLTLDVDASRIIIRVKGTNNERKEFVYNEAGALLNTLNTANLTTKSLQRRILENLVADGKLLGAMDGTPD